MKRQGFTLIELLVVIAIIGLLSTLAVVALGSAKVKARDANRFSDLKGLQAALELYYTDQSAYPAGTNVTLGVGMYSCLNASGWAPAGCANPYLGKVPNDPNGAAYVYSAGSNTYTITATLEGKINDLSGTIKLTPAGIGAP